eukprot:5230174-Pyramimonas_sp.AAC.1
MSPSPLTVWAASRPWCPWAPRPRRPSLVAKVTAHRAKITAHREDNRASRAAALAANVPFQRALARGREDNHASRIAGREARS